MTRFYVHREPGLRETLGALAVALGVGAVSFHCVRMLLAREGLEREAPKRAPLAGADLSPAADQDGCRVRWCHGR